MSKKVDNRTIKIKCADQQTASVLFSALRSYSDQLMKGVNTAMRQAGKGVTDAAFENINDDKFTMECSLKPKDKGTVLTSDGKGNLAVTPYTSLSDMDMYAILQSGRVFFYIKDNEGYDLSVAEAVDFDQIPQVIDANQADMRKQLTIRREKEKAQQAALKKAAEESQVEEAVEVSDVEMEVVKDEQ